MHQLSFDALNYGYFTKFDDFVRKQFLKANIISPPARVISDVVELEKIQELLSFDDLQTFKKILKFKARQNESSAEYAIAWLTNGTPIGSKQGKVDVTLPDGTGLSVKCCSFTRSIKFGRCASSSSYKELMCVWSFFVGFLYERSAVLNPTRITKKQISNVDIQGSADIISFLETSRADPLLETGVLQFVEKLYHCTNSLNDYIIDLVNNISREILDKAATHLVLLDPEAVVIRVISHINKASFCADFYTNYFDKIEGNELFIKLGEVLDE